jgi:lipopolysaccharide transport system ATP-binding protein
MKPIISVRNLSKKYIIGENISGRGARTFRDIFDYKTRRLFRKDVNRRKEDTTIWALKNVSFDVDQGEVVGIIGCNGAGKSTLLKILSRITEPTEGDVTLRGRVASLLEVGTGFSAELTGRENIFLNGSILGMKKKEIRQKFDEIVAFAEVEKFIDTPVKRYSSGMYVRLAFAVAAHLEPEILLVDEVLAVGDMSFQKKSAQKMRDISGTGRTVLFVSHNMLLIRNMCTRCCLLEKGGLAYSGESSEVIGKYLATQFEEKLYRVIQESNHVFGISKVRVEDIAIVDETGVILREVLYHQPIRIQANLRILSDIPAGKFSLAVLNSEDVRVFMTHSCDNDFDYQELRPGRYKIEVCLSNILKPGDYKIEVGGHQLPSTVSICHVPDALYFHVSDQGFTANDRPSFCNRNSIVDATSTWVFRRQDPM